MKQKIIAIFLFVAMCLSFAACSDDNGETTDKTADTTTAAAAEKTENTFGDLHAIVDKVKGFYGDDVEFIFNEDEYSEEVLMFNYGLYDDNNKYINAIESYVLTECEGMSADTFAIVTFKKGTDKALIEEAAKVMETEYVESLKSNLAAYNPEEFAASDGYQIKIYDDAMIMVISSENAEKIISAVGK